jgi:hypothetical protein
MGIHCADHCAHHAIPSACNDRHHFAGLADAQLVYFTCGLKATELILFVCVCVYLFIYLFVCLFIYLYAAMCVCVCVCVCVRACV